LRGCRQAAEAILEGEILNHKHEILNKRKEELNSSHKNTNVQTVQDFEFGN
jgi:hypothetical protein